jgi:hypothetical protein
MLATQLEKKSVLSQHLIGSSKYSSWHLYGLCGLLVSCSTSAWLTHLV